MCVFEIFWPLYDFILCLPVIKLIWLGNLNSIVIHFKIYKLNLRTEWTVFIVTLAWLKILAVQIVTELVPEILGILKPKPKQNKTAHKWNIYLIFFLFIWLRLSKLFRYSGITLPLKSIVKLISEKLDQF